MITITNLSKSYGKRTLFSNLNLTINRGEKIGFVGPNGAGKTTLFSLILGNMEPSQGNIQINKGARVGYLPQEASFDSQDSVLSEVIKGDKTIIQLKDEKAALEKANKADSKQYGEILHKLEFLGYFDLEHKAKKILGGLGFKESDFKRPINQMSGGWQMRALLAKLLTLHYDILLLDEPMNHLDLNAAIWLKEYLSNFKEAFVMISHDRDFLDDVANYTVILENGTVAKVRGNYEHYQKIQEEKSIHLIKQLKEQEKKRLQLETFVSRFHGQPNKASQVRAKKRVLEKMDKIELPKTLNRNIRNFRFPQSIQSGYTVMTLKKIFKSYGSLNPVRDKLSSDSCPISNGVKVYEDFDFEVTKGEKAVLVGPNGAGKSTLLKILAGVVDIDKGWRTLGHNVNIGYFSQARMETLNAYNTVFEEAYSAAEGKLLPEGIRTVLGAFLFSGDDVDKNITVLSGGEKSRLNLAKLLMNPPNFLLLDEPTTHLDVDAVEALIKALSQYQGTLIFISHDIHFVRSVANTVYDVNSGKVRKFSGGFDYYRRMAKEENVEMPKKQSHKPHISEKQMRIAERDQKKKQKANNEKIARRLKELRKEEEGLKMDRSIKARILSNPRSYHNKEMIMEYGKALKEIETRLSEIEAEIKELKEKFI
ncbi:MAG: ribosomal protection-like ABC-F family protein [Candidatus Omnitrophota bacterium]